MSASLGQRSVLTRSELRPDKEADSAPDYSTLDLGTGQIPPSFRSPPLSRTPRPRNGQRRVGRRGGHIPWTHLHAAGDSLHVPLPGHRPRPLVPGLGGAADRLARGQSSQALRAGYQQLLPGSPATPRGG